MLSSTVQSEAAAPYHLYRMADADIEGASGVDGQGPYMRLFAKLATVMMPPENSVVMSPM